MASQPDVARRAALTVLVAATLALVAWTAQRADAVVGSAPDATVLPVINASVNAIVQAGDRVILGGAFSRIGVPTTNFADLDVGDGSPSLAGARPNTTASVIVPDGAGGWYIGGLFTAVGALTRNHLAHLLPDGSVDPSFDPNLSDSAVTLVLSGTTLYAGGFFTTVNGSTTRNHVAAFDTTTGLATSFDPNVGGNVSALALSGSTLYAGGLFATVNGATARNGLAAFDTTTGTATGFDAGLDTGTSTNRVAALALSGSTLYVGGKFAAVNTTGGVGGVPRAALAAFDTATGQATGFDAAISSSGPFVNAIAVSGATVYAAGVFTTIGASTARNGVAAFDAATGAVTSCDPNVNGAVSAIVPSGATTYLGGAFTTINGGLSRNRVAAVDATTCLATSFDPNFDGNVSALALQGGRLAAGGQFGILGSGSLHPGLVALRPDGTLDPDFTPSVNGTVNALAISGGRLYAGGGFTAVNGTTRNRLAALDPVSGALDGAFNPNASNTVSALAVAGNTLYAGGTFTTVNGSTTRNRLAALDATTGVATPGFDPNLSSGTVNALALSATTLYAGGSFTTVNGSTGRNGLAAFDATSGVAVAAFNPNMNNTVSSLLLAGSTLYAGGFFTATGSGAGTLTRNRLAAVDATSGAITAFNPSVEPGAVTALSLSGSTLYAGGTFTKVNGVADRSNLAAFDVTTGAVDSSFIPNPNANVLALLASGSRLYTGGNFTTIGGASRFRFAQFSEAASPPLATTGAASAITAGGASVDGSVNPNGVATAYVVEYGTTSSFGAISAPSSLGSGTGAIAVSASLAGLAADTTYYYRVVATSSAGTSFGSVGSFRTAGGPPQPRVTTLAASATTNTTATLSGQVNPNGQATSYTFEYGPTASFGSISTVTRLDDASVFEAVGVNLTNLQPDTTYAFRVVATNAAGTAAGAVGQFTTGPGGVPIVTTGGASAITASGATLSGTFDPHGLQTAFTFVYGTSTADLSSITAVDSAEGATNGAQAVALPAGALQPATTYVYRLVATNAGGTSLGPVRSFTTAGPGT